MNVKRIDKFLTSALIISSFIWWTGASAEQSSKIKFAPYFDVSLEGTENLVKMSDDSGQKKFTLAFAMGGTQGCVPMWGSQYDFEDPKVLGPIKNLQSKGGDFIIATGGSMGPYLEHLCHTSNSLANAYKKVLDTVGSKELDIDIEAPIDNKLVNNAVAELQKGRPDVVITYTLMVQGDNDGILQGLGVDVLKNAKENGVRVDYVNIMAMEFPSEQSSWGDAVINSAESTKKQMAKIWPEKSSKELYAMLSITPMIGKNFNGKEFKQEDARKLVEWANENHIGRLNFWSFSRDNGGCEGVAPNCSGISQSQYEFTKIFKDFTG